MTNWSAIRHNLKSITIEEADEVLSKSFTNILGEPHQCEIMSVDFAGDDTRVVLSIRKLPNEQEGILV